MATRAHQFDDDVAANAPPRVYTMCMFDRGVLVPNVQLIDATSDKEAVSEANAMHRFTRREIWDRHRLVAVIPAAH